MESLVKKEIEITEKNEIKKSKNTNNKTNIKKTDSYSSIKWLTGC